MRAASGDRLPRAVSGPVVTHARALLGAAGIRPRKTLGQHFLMDTTVASRIAQLCAGTPRLLEIGAGTGALTSALLATATEITALELDARLVEILKQRSDLGGVHIVCADALQFDYAAYSAHGPWLLCGNLPYNIATPLMIMIATEAWGPQRAVAMIQKDVAQRVTASSGTSAYGSLSVAIQLTMRVRRAFEVPPSAFFPKPKVESSVIVLERRSDAIPAAQLPAVLKVSRAAFAYRRKTLANSLVLALGIPRTRAESALRATALSPEIRGEQLGLAEFVALAEHLE